MLITAALAALISVDATLATPINDPWLDTARDDASNGTQAVDHADEFFVGGADLQFNAPTMVVEGELPRSENVTTWSSLKAKILTASSTLALFVVGLFGIIYLVRRHRRTIEYLCPIWLPKKITGNQVLPNRRPPATNIFLTKNNPNRRGARDKVTSRPNGMPPRPRDVFGTEPRRSGPSARQRPPNPTPRQQR